METISKKIEAYKESLLEDLKVLVEIDSSRDETTKSEGAPFGQGVKRSFDAFETIAKRLGFFVKNVDGYAIYATNQESDEYVASIGHLDVVEAGDLSQWKTPPFSLVQKEDMLFGRGVNDDKGPLLASLYAMRIACDLGIEMKYPMRVIAGGAEETTWECMEHYFKKHSQPVMGFSPDGNFPIVNGEKGILQMQAHFAGKENGIEWIHCSHPINYVSEEVQIKVDSTWIENLSYLEKVDEIQEEKDGFVLVYKGTKSLSRNPQRAKNPLWAISHDFLNIPTCVHGFNNVLKFLDAYFVDDFYGKKSGMYHEDDQMGMTSICPMTLEQDQEGYTLTIDYRYIKGVDPQQAFLELQKKAEASHGTLTVMKEKRMLFVDPNSDLIHALQNAYETVMHEKAEVFTKGGASYARVMDHGVAFGATFENEDPKPHMPNEQMPLSSLLKACEIYVHAFVNMAKK